MARKRRDDDEDDDDLPKRKNAPVDDDDDENDNDDEMGTVKKKSGAGNDAYTGLLAIALLAMVAACVLFFLDHSELSKQPLTAPNVTVPALSGR